LNTKELTVLYLITYHNLYFMQNLMRRIQIAIGKGTFSEFQEEFGEKWSSRL
jgi:tRNA-guanine family transglycosylase